MFFVVRSNDSFNFPLELIKCIVIVTPLCVDSFLPCVLIHYDQLELSFLSVMCFLRLLCAIHMCSTTIHKVSGKSGEFGTSSKDRTLRSNLRSMLLYVHRDRTHYYFTLPLLSIGMPCFNTYFCDLFLFLSFQIAHSEHRFPAPSSKLCQV